MKTSYQNLWLAVITAALIFNSCKKDIHASTQTSVQENTVQTDNLLHCNNCYITHTEEDIFGSIINFVYNKRGNPDSLNFDGTPVTLEYDKSGRLTKETFGTWAWNEFKYKGANLLPYAYYYYYPDFGGLIAIDSFKYNLKGELITSVVANLLFPEYNNIEHYNYNLRGNVVKVDIAAHNGGTIFSPGYTEFTASKYDDKPNFITASAWTKFMMFNTEYDGDPYLWMLFSRNNAANYKWIYDNAGDSYSVTSNFQYNNQDFANVISMDYYDNTAEQELGTFTRTSTSMCDKTPFNSQQSTLANLHLLKKRINKNKFGIPSPIK